MPSREWTADELSAGNVFGLQVNGPNPRDIPDLPTPGKLLRLPLRPSSVNAMFRESSRNTRNVVRELARLGYVVDEITAEYVAVSEVGRSRMTLTLWHDGEMPIEISRVRFGNESWNARQAAEWLHKRSS